MKKISVMQFATIVLFALCSRCFANPIDPSWEEYAPQLWWKQNKNFVIAGLLGLLIVLVCIMIYQKIKKK